MLRQWFKAQQQIHNKITGKKKNQDVAHFKSGPQSNENAVKP